jgi:hypothetical protein
MNIRLTTGSSGILCGTQIHKQYTKPPSAQSHSLHTDFFKLILGGAEATEAFHNNVWPKNSAVSATSFISPDILLLTYSYAHKRDRT